MINIYVAGQPVGKARPRVTRTGRVYTPTKTMKAEASIQDAAREAMQGQQPMEGPVYVSAAFNMAIPTSWTKGKQTQARNDELMPTAKPDLDNLAKTILDALNGIVYRDDSQVVQLAISKRYSDQPGTFITIRPA